MLSQNNQDTVDLIKYLELIANNWALIIKVSICVLVLSIILSLLLPKSYSSTASFIPPQQESGLMATMLMRSIISGGITNLPSDFLDRGSQADLYAGLLSSDEIGDAIIDKYKLYEVYGLKYRLDAYKKLKSISKIEAGKKSGIISVTVEDWDPKRSAAMANSYVDELGKMLAGMSILTSKLDKNYLKERLDKAKSDLVITEDALKHFQAKNNTFDISEQLKGTIKGVADLEGQLAVEEVKLAGLTRVFTEGSTEVKNQRSIVVGLKNHIAKIESNRTSGVLPGAGSIPELGQQYIRLTREFKIKESVVELLTKQYEVSKLTETKDYVTLQIVQKAKVPDKKIKPKRQLIVFGMTVSAFFGTILFIFLQDYFSRRTEEDKRRLELCKRQLLFKEID